MTLPCEDIRDFLVEEGILKAGASFIGQEPPLPIESVTLFDTGGGEQDPKFALDEITFQVRSRTIKYKDGYLMLDKVKKFLEGKGKTILNGVTYIGFWVYTNIERIGFDDGDHAIWVVNFRSTRVPRVGESGNRIII